MNINLVMLFERLAFSNGYKIEKICNTIDISKENPIERLGRYTTDVLSKEYEQIEKGVVLDITTALTDYSHGKITLYGKDKKELTIIYIYEF